MCCGVQVRVTKSEVVKIYWVSLGGWMPIDGQITSLFNIMIGYLK